MNCPVCDTQLKEGKWTCTPQCAGKLASSWRVANDLKRKFNTEDKNYIREKLYSFIKNHTTLVQNQGTAVSILDLWGGGLFSDYILDRIKNVQNHGGFVLYEIDNNPKLFPALKDYANRKNQNVHVKNQEVVVIPFCSSLAEFFHICTVKNQSLVDFIWLDYCGGIVNLRKDIELVKKVVGKDTIIAVTLMRARDNQIDGQNRHKSVDGIVSDYLPLHKRFYTHSYSSDAGNMELYVYKIDSKLKKFKYLSFLF